MRAPSLAGASPFVPGSVVPGHAYIKTFFSDRFYSSTADVLDKLPFSATIPVSFS